jgi:1-acyl-sn-glycerol-3-phosphate acyltransferase
MRYDKNIFKKSFAYTLLKNYVDVCFKLFYKVSYTNKEKTPSKGKLIFAPNHQNALMDALAVLFSFTWQPVFLARSDIFANKTAARILSFLKILPVYRIRDGYDQLANNKDVFEQIFRVFDHDTPITILPEGNHDDRKLLRPLKKGIARMAFSYRHQKEEKQEIQIIPVGLNYSRHHHPGSNLHIRYGDPINISEFDEPYLENQAKGYNSFLSTLSERLKENILHISKMDHYNTISDLLDISKALLTARGYSQEMIFTFQKKIIDKIETNTEEEPQITETLKQINNELQAKLKQEKLTNYDFSQWDKSDSTLLNTVKMGLLALLSPLYLYAMVNNVIPGLIVKRISRLFKDPQFVSTITFVAIIVIYPLVHLLQSLLAGLVFQSFFVALIYAATLLPGFFFERFFTRTWKNLIKRFKINKIKKEVDKGISSINDATGFLDITA